MTDYRLIDPPDHGFHLPAIEAWIAELQAMPDSVERDEALESALEDLAYAKRIEEKVDGPRHDRQPV